MSGRELIDSGGGGGHRGRVTAALGSWRPPETYNQPHLEPNGNTRTTEHEVLADKTVVQILGEEAETFRLRGDAYAEDIAELRSMRGDVVQLRHPIHSGQVLVTGVSANHEGAWDDVDGERKWIYGYFVDLVEA